MTNDAIAGPHNSNVEISWKLGAIVAFGLGGACALGLVRLQSKRRPVKDYRRAPSCDEDVQRPEVWDISEFDSRE